MGRIPISLDEYLRPERYQDRWARRARRQRCAVLIAVAALLGLLFLMELG